MPAPLKSAPVMIRIPKIGGSEIGAPKNCLMQIGAKEFGAAHFGLG